MRKEDISDALNDVDFDMVEQAYENAPKIKAPVWRRWAALAASLVLIIGAAIVFLMQQPNVPIWDTALYSAEEIARLFVSNTLDSSATNAYTEVYVPDSKFLQLVSVPKDTHLNLYQQTDPTKALNEAELRTFTNMYLLPLTAALGKPVTEYKIGEYEGIFRKNLKTQFDNNIPYSMSAIQNDEINRLCILSREDPLLVLDGEPVQIDQRLSDEEIIASLQPIKKKLLQIFGGFFPNAKVVRRFDSNSQNGAEFISIFFYNESAHPLNKIQSEPVSDFIEIRFDNFRNAPDEIVSDSILTDATICYTKLRCNVNDLYQLTAKAKKISLEEAEALLYKGYVFGNAVCTFCMQQQDKVSFEDYDFVDIEYVFGSPYSEDPKIGLPFYAFYKNIGTARNGNKIYAKTYVPAIEVEGYEEYFETLHKKHNTN